MAKYQFKPIKSSLNYIIRLKNFKVKSYIVIISDIATISIVKVADNIDSQENSLDNNIIPRQDNFNDFTIAISPASLKINNSIVAVVHFFFHFFSHMSYFCLYFTLFFTLVITLLDRHFLHLECFILDTVDIISHPFFYPCCFLRNNLHQLRIALLIRHSHIAL